VLEPLLLIAGLDFQMVTMWPDGFCHALADRGFQVARFDNADYRGDHAVGRGRVRRRPSRPAVVIPLKFSPARRAQSASLITAGSAGR
jgi:hypothetical protein